MNVTVRDAAPNELQAVLDLYRHLHAHDEPLKPQRAEAVWREILDSPGFRCFVAEADGRLVASCVLAIIPNLTRGARPYGLVENVITHPEYRRRGIGTMVLRRAMDVAWERGCYKVMLLTGREDAHGFYEQVGFRRGVKTGFVATPNA